MSNREEQHKQQEIHSLLTKESIDRQAAYEKLQKDKKIFYMQSIGLCLLFIVGYFLALLYLS